MARQRQMPQDDAPLQDAVGVEYRVPGLGHHGFNGGFCLSKVVRCGGKFRRQGGGDVFQIGQPDVDVPAPGLHILHGLIAAGVAHNGQMQALCPGKIQCGSDPGPPLAWRDQIDVVGSLCLQAEKDFGQMLHADLLAQPFGADGEVLAEAALEGAAGKEHGAAATGAADAGLLPEMQGSAGGFQGAARAAEAHGSGSPVHPAAAGAQGAVGGRRDKIGFRHNIQSPLCKVCCPQYTTFYTGRAIL